ncbi:carbohydrate ABC transporter permease [Actinokineospora sp. NBRC 105648]|uniref:carbohydrate ABC transporter permease n=1 Tax=Actinokineospora sp. NBRC 105648 TaxID=3032206 RepID=UPI0024A05E7A|nr:carbohydrate ABC transporter permease [Actinokineospora sp. NBRC 105648]GLZ36513.1 ABC transporter permease [Actinokineospora sp. NBRC 105648]
MTATIEPTVHEDQVVDHPAAADEPVGHRGRGVVGHVVLAVLSLACLFPIYWLYATSLRAPEDVYSLSVLPWPLSLDNYADAFAKTDMVRMLVNTTVVAVLTALGQLLTGLLAAYAFAAWRFRFQKLLYLMFVGTWLVPFQVTMLPNYVLLSQLSLLNTLAGVIVPTLCSALGVLLLRQHLMGFPKELLEAARMDGRSSWGILWTVVVPTLRPVLAALGILLVITAWNEYFWPAMVLQRSNGMVQLGLRSFMGTEGNDWGPLMAAAGLTCLPIFLLYLVLQRHIVNAFVRSGLK